MPIDTRKFDMDQMLRANARDRAELHEKAVKAIAEARFAFPTPEHSDYRTHVNVPEPTMPVELDTGETLVPDIVVTETKNNELRIHAKVATSADVTLEEAERTWLPLSRIADSAFYLYVPVGYGRLAKQLCKQAGVRVDGFRTWRFTPRGIEVNDISEAPNPLTLFLPPIVRRFLEPAAA